MHKAEAYTILKKSHKLNMVTLYPSSLDKQKVSLSSNVFHETTAAALVSEKNENYEGTIEFLQIIQNWWQIVSTIKLFKGISTRNDFAKPIYTPNDKQVVYLKQFGTWLKNWKNLHFPDMCLTNETFNAISHTNATLIDFINYSFEKYQVKYILLGKIQTNNLEFRWGKYKNHTSKKHILNLEDSLQLNKYLHITLIVFIFRFLLIYLFITITTCYEIKKKNL